MNIDVAKEIRRAVDSGIVSFGEREAEKIILKDKVQLVIISANASKQSRERIEQYCKISETPVFGFKGNGLELGTICGKPFTVSMLAVKNAGKSKILSALKQKSKESTK